MFQYFKKVKPSYYLIFGLAIINLLVAYFYIKTPFSYEYLGDSGSYFVGMEYLQGNEIQDNIPYNRLLTTPALLYSTIFINKAFAVGDLHWSLMILNIIFYFLIIYFFYKLAWEIFKDEKIAVLSSILFFSNYCLFTFGTTFLSDMGGWFFFILASCWAVRFYNSKNKKYYFWAILSASIGVLFKEYGALGLITLGMVILISDYSWPDKVREIFKAGVLFLIIPLLFHIGFYLVYNYSYFDWYLSNIQSYQDESPLFIKLKVLTKVLGWLYLVGWPIFLYGLWQVKKSLSREKIVLLAALLPASLAFLAWPAATQRIAFIFVPWLALVSGFGLAKAKNSYIVYLVILFYIIVSYHIEMLKEIINLPV